MTDFTVPLWLLKLGTVLNLYFFFRTLGLSAETVGLQLLVPAQILFVVSAYRCFFPNRYGGNIVFHETRLSSTLVTRVLATAVEVSYIYAFAYVLRRLNVGEVGWVNVVAWAMVAQVVVSQGFVWGAILTARPLLYFYEEIGWWLIFAANTAASAFLMTRPETPVGAELLTLNLIFGLFYLPWQLLHLWTLRREARHAGPSAEPLSWAVVSSNARRAFEETNRRTDAASWGGFVGLTWMSAYWAMLVPPWLYYIVLVFSVPER